MTDASLDTALAFARRGLGVVPIWPPIEKAGKLVCGCGNVDCKSPGKHPIARLGKSGPTLAPNGVNSATTDSGILKHWFGSLAPDANIGVSSANLVVLDVDPRHDGSASLAALERLGTLPPSWSVKTGSGGAHIYYQRPAGLDLKLPIIAENIARAGATPPLGAGIDIPSYCIAPPSRHICGQSYSWDNHPDKTALAEAPAWLIERLVAPPTGRSASSGRSPPNWANALTSPITEYRDVAASQTAGVALRGISDVKSGWHFLRTWNRLACDPPLPEGELWRIFDRIAERERSKWE